MFYKIIAVVALLVSFSSNAFVKEAQEPTKLSERLIKIENILNEYEKFIKNGTSDLKSLKLRTSNLESMFVSQASGSAVPDKKDAKASENVTYSFVSF